MNFQKDYRKRPPYPLGPVDAVVTVIDRTGGSTTKSYKYKVIYKCCGKEGILGHTSVGQRRLDYEDGKRSPTCVSCARKMRAEQLRTEIRVGQRVGNCKVLDRYRNGKGEFVYEVEFLCCGDQGSVTHSRLLQREIEKPKTCPHCKQRRQPRRLSIEEMRAGWKGVVDGNGQFWHFLGKLGRKGAYKAD